MEILTDEASLRQPCLPCSSVEEGLQISSQLSTALTASPVLGIGLAANQIGIHKRACLLRVLELEPQGFGYLVELTLINPKITKLSQPVIFSQEGCLSFPGQAVRTLRYASCTVMDDLEPSGRELIGIRAICAQHEIEHLNSKTMYDAAYDKVQRNQSCPCGSGSKFKACCLPKVKEWK